MAAMVLQQTNSAQYSNISGQGKHNIVSPDRTAASTPPNSPPGFGNEFTSFDNNVFHQAATEEDQLSPLKSAATNGQAVAAATSTTNNPKNKQLLRVDKILCRAPSHESNISDLSASLSPTTPRGPAPGARRKGGAKATATAAQSDNIVYNLLNECGVFEPVSDLLGEAGFHGLEDGAPPPPPPPPPPSNKDSKPYYETPNVWGVAPNGDDESTTRSTPSKRNKQTQYVDKLKMLGSMESCNESVEYDNVELVLDESTLLPPPSSGPPVSRSATSQSAASGGGGLLGTKSWADKLGSLGGRKTTPTPTPTEVSNNARSVTVISSKEAKSKKDDVDPRISHMYDITQFENEELRPSLGSVSVSGSGSGLLGKSGKSKKKSAAAGGGGAASVASAPEKGSADNKKRKGLLKGLSIKPSKKGDKSSNKNTAPTKKAKDDTHLPNFRSSPSKRTPTVEHVTAAKKWKATYDKASNKYYYYHRDTKEVTWTKPVGFDEAYGLTVDSPNKNKQIKGAVVLKEVNKIESRSRTMETTKVSNTTPAVVDTNKYWRKTVDGTTGKTYYYNKKTKEVSWTMPKGYSEEDKNKKVEETAAMISVADKRKKSSWFNKKKASLSDKALTNNVEAKTENNKDAATDADTDAKYWRATLDASTGKTYFFNKKTKLVQWTKPDGFVENESPTKKAVEETKKDVDQNGAAKVEEAVEATETAVINPDDTFDMDTANMGDEESEIEGLDDAEAIDSSSPTRKQRPTIDADAPFDEPDAPFDEPEPDVLSSSLPSKQTNALLAKSQKEVDERAKQEDDSDDEEEQEDSFDADSLDDGKPFDRQTTAKSLRSGFELGRNITHASNMTDTTRKAANTGRPMKKDTTPPVFVKKTNDEAPRKKEQKKDDNSRRPPLDSTPSRYNKLKDGLQMPATSPSRSFNNSSNRRYGGKRAENLGDSSIDDSTLDHHDKSRQNDDDQQYWSGDDVSALSGIGNESIESKRKRRAEKRNQSGGEDGSRQNKETATPNPHNVNEWTQEELDSFISKNDWGSVAKYINEMRNNKAGSGIGNRDNRNNDEGPSIQEIRERIEYDRSLEKASPMPKTRFGARSQMHHDHQHQHPETSFETTTSYDETRSRASQTQESESVWQSLSSASYESEESSEYCHQQQQTRRGGPSGKRRAKAL